MDIYPEYMNTLFVTKPPNVAWPDRFFIITACNPRSSGDRSSDDKAHVNGSVEQNLVLRFLNQRCIRQGFESETDYFGSDLTLAQWARDARVWAAELRGKEPETCAAMFEASGAETIEAVRKLFRSEIGLTPSNTEHLDAAIALIRWAKRRRGFEFSDYRARLWDFVVEIVDAALWLGWLFPRIHQKLQTVPGSAWNRE